MSLTLTITSYQRLSPGQQASRELGQGTLTIGRSTDNDWPLPDPEMILSKQHCVVEYRDGGYFLTDTSTNGVFVNHSDERVGRGRSVRLHEADILRLGDYELQVHLGEAPSGQVQPSAAPLGSDSDLFGPATEQLDLGSPGAARLGPGSAASEPLSSNAWSESSDPLGLGESRQRDWDQLSEPDQLPADQQFFQPPSAYREEPPVDNGPNIIPDDWDQSVPPLASDSPPPMPEPKVDPAAADRVTPPPRQDPTPPAPVASAPAAAGDMAAALRAFLRGAGVDESLLAQSDPETVMAELGAIYRQTVEGLMELLRARTNVKTEFRVERTMIGPVANNPLKALPTPDEAIKAMLDKHGSVWQSSEQAVREGFADVRAHELAVLAGMQAALKRMLTTFDPNNLETYMEGQSRLAGVLSGGRKARYWDAFKGLYDRLAAKAEEDFEALFREEFARAYEAQQQKLRQH